MWQAGRSEMEWDKTLPNNNKKTKAKMNGFRVLMIDCSNRDVSPWVRRRGAVVSKVVYLRVGVAGLDDR